MPAMGWVRRHHRFGAWLAVAALALQIALSFGHVHLDGAGATTMQRGAATAQSGDGAGYRRADHGGAAMQVAQPTPASNPSEDDYCPICASIFLASTAAAAQPPILPAPPVATQSGAAIGAAGAAVMPRTAAFHSRAPPAA